MIRFIVGFLPYGYPFGGLINKRKRTGCGNTRGAVTAKMVPVEGGPEAVVPELLKPASFGSWAVVQDGIYFVNAQATPRRAIEFFSFDTRQLKRVAAVANEKFGPGLTVSPDRQWILYVQKDLDNSDIMLVENFR